MRAEKELSSKPAFRRVLRFLLQLQDDKYTEKLGHTALAEISLKPVKNERGEGNRREKTQCQAMKNRFRYDFFFKII